MTSLCNLLFSYKSRNNHTKIISSLKGNNDDSGSGSGSINNDDSGSGSDNGSMKSS